MRLTIGLFLGPAGSGDQQQVGFGANGLSIGGGFAYAHYRRALAGLRHSHWDVLDAGSATLTLPGGLAAGIDEDEPGPLGAMEDGFQIGRASCRERVQIS